MDVNYKNQYYTFTNNEISYNKPDNMYTIDDGDGSYSFDNTDFSFYEFRSNLVVR